MEKPVVLLSALDWGFGHATRCIPIIQELITLNFKVIVACNSVQNQLLAPDLPGVTFVNLEGYNMRYSTTKRGTLAAIIFQVPKILIKINREKRWLAKFIAQHSVRLVISDNRFGFYHSQVPSIFITHQLEIRSGLGDLINGTINAFNRRCINKFSACWVPDAGGDENMAGSLSHPAKKPRVPLRYIGNLSRLKPCDADSASNPILFVLSGPEPQRSILEKIIVEQLERVQLNAILVRGIVGGKYDALAVRGVKIVNFAGVAQLQQLICNAKLVCCRSGYTSMMDVLKLRKRCIAIPTPGQAEQEYLAQHLFERNFVFAVLQSKLNLGSVLKQVDKFPFRDFPQRTDAFKHEIRDAISTLAPLE